MIVGRDGFMQLSAEGEWIGDLGHLEHGAGYLFFSNNDKEFIYNIVAESEAQPSRRIERKESEAGWVCHEWQISLRNACDCTHS